MAPFVVFAKAKTISYLYFRFYLNVIDTKTVSLVSSKQVVSAAKEPSFRHFYQYQESILEGARGDLWRNRSNVSAF